ncbi:MAG TPA: thiamine-binding protein [Syntrophomonadaceae bacterium]|nr:thiamine-binding protein [Syntrophomonadaceae bacterium]
MANANLSLQIIPAVEEEDLYAAVDEVIALIKESGFPYIVGPMETTVEGDLSALLQLVRDAHELCAQRGVPRVVSVVKIDYKPDGVTMDEKIAPHRR